MTYIDYKIGVNKFSVAIVTRNRASLLINAIESLNRQSVSPYEVLVVDNASTDNTRNIIDKIDIRFPLKYIFCEELGVNAARNAAIANSTGDIIAFIDDDAEADPNWLEKLLGAFRKYDDAAAVVGVKENMFPSNFAAALMQFTMRSLSIARDRVGDIVLSPTIVDSCNLAFKRQLIIDNGIFFDNTFIGGGDRHFGHQLFRLNLKIYFCETAIVYHCWPKSLSKYFRMRCWSGMIKAALRANLGENDFSMSTIRWGPLEVASLAWKNVLHFPFIHRVIFLMLVGLGQICNKIGYLSTIKKIDNHKRLGKSINQKSILYGD